MKTINDQARLNGTTGLNSGISEFPATQFVFASPIDPNSPTSKEQANNELNTFFMQPGGLYANIPEDETTPQIYWEQILPLSYRCSA